MWPLAGREQGEAHSQCKQELRQRAGATERQGWWESGSSGDSTAGLAEGKETGVWGHGGDTRSLPSEPPIWGDRGAGGDLGPVLRSPLASGGDSLYETVNSISGRGVSQGRSGGSLSSCWETSVRPTRHVARQEPPCPRAGGGCLHRGWSQPRPEGTGLVKRRWAGRRDPPGSGSASHLGRWEGQGCL